MKILGLPLQFVLVVVVSAMVTIYLLAAVADQRVEARSNASPGESALILGDGAYMTVPGDALTGTAQEADSPAQADGWETALLIFCPLH